MAITYVAAGTWAAAAQTISPALPAGMTAGDLMIVAVQTPYRTLATPSGWTALPGSPLHTGANSNSAGATTIEVWYKWWESGDSAPTFDLSVLYSNSIQGQVFGFRGVDPDTPLDATPTTTTQATATTSLSLSSITTTEDSSMICWFVGMDRDANSTANVSAVTNANLTSVTERADRTVATGVGGGLWVGTGYKATAGATGTTTLTQTSSIAVGFTVALRANNKSFINTTSTVTGDMSVPGGAIDSAWLLPGTAASSDWSSPNNIKARDSSNAQIATNTSPPGVITASNFPWPGNLSSGASIYGVEVRTRGQTYGTGTGKYTVDNSLTMYSDAIGTSSSRASVDNWLSTYTDVVHGDLNDTWGYTSPISGADLLDPSFKIDFSVTETGGATWNVGLDSIEIRVKYRVPVAVDKELESTVNNTSTVTGGLSISNPATIVNTGWLFPSAATGWVDSSNVYATDGAEATISADSQILNTSSYSFPFSYMDQIRGIEMRITRRSTTWLGSYSRDYNVALHTTALGDSENFSIVDYYPTTLASQVYGDSEARWFSGPLTAAQLLDSSFKTILECASLYPNISPYVDSVELRVYYIPYTLASNVDATTTISGSLSNELAVSTSIDTTTTLSADIKRVIYVDNDTSLYYPSATSTTGGVTTWNTPSNVYASDNTYAWVLTHDVLNQNTYLDVLGFDMSYNSDATINSVSCNVEMYANPTGATLESIQILKNGIPSGTLYTPGTVVSGTETIYYPSTADKWGTTIDPADLNDPEFGLRLRFAADGYSYHNTLVDDPGSDYPGTVSTGGGSVNAWNIPSNAISDDDVYSTMTTVSNVPSENDYIKASNFGFALPTNATITSIWMWYSIFRSGGTTGEIRTDTLQLCKGGVLVGDNKATADNWPTSETYMGIDDGGSPGSDLWGTTWTPEDINDSSFGVWLRPYANISGTDRTANIDYVQLGVYYNVPNESNIYVDSIALSVNADNVLVVLVEPYKTDIITQSTISATLSNDKTLSADILSTSIIDVTITGPSVDLACELTSVSNISAYISYDSVLSTTISPTTDITSTIGIDYQLATNTTSTTTITSDIVTEKVYATLITPTTTADGSVLSREVYYATTIDNISTFDVDTFYREIGYSSNINTLSTVDGSVLSREVYYDTSIDAITTNSANIVNDNAFATTIDTTSTVTVDTVVRTVSPTGNIDAVLTVEDVLLSRDKVFSVSIDAIADITSEIFTPGTISSVITPTSTVEVSEFILERNFITDITPLTTVSVSSFISTKPLLVTSNGESTVSSDLYKETGLSGNIDNASLVNDTMLQSIKPLSSNIITTSDISGLYSKSVECAANVDSVTTTTSLITIDKTYSTIVNNTTTITSDTIKDIGLSVNVDAVSTVAPLITREIEYSGSINVTSNVEADIFNSFRGDIITTSSVSGEWIVTKPIVAASDATTNVIGTFTKDVFFDAEVYNTSLVNNTLLRADKPLACEVNPQTTVDIIISKDIDVSGNIDTISALNVNSNNMRDRGFVTSVDTTSNVISAVYKTSSFTVTVEGTSTTVDAILSATKVCQAAVDATSDINTQLSIIKTFAEQVDVISATQAALTTERLFVAIILNVKDVSYELKDTNTIVITETITQDTIRFIERSILIPQPPDITNVTVEETEYTEVILTPPDQTTIII